MHLSTKLAAKEFQIRDSYLKFISNSYLKFSRAYHACQIKLLKEEILFKKIKNQNTGETLRRTLGIIDYTHVICLFPTQNDWKFAHNQNIHSKKLFNLGLEFSKV